MKRSIGRQIIAETPADVRKKVIEYATTLFRELQIEQLEVNNKKIPKKT